MQSKGRRKFVSLVAMFCFALINKCKIVWKEGRSFWGVIKLRKYFEKLSGVCYPMRLKFPISDSRYS